MLRHRSATSLTMLCYTIPLDGAAYVAAIRALVSIGGERYHGVSHQFNPSVTFLISALSASVVSTHWDAPTVSDAGVRRNDG